MASDLADVVARLPQGLHARVGTHDDVVRAQEFLNRFATPGRWMSPQVVRRALLDNPEPDRLVILAEDASGDVQAYAAVSDGGVWASPDHSWRAHLRVAPEWRRRGVGRALLGELEAHARSRGAARTISSVSANETSGLAFAEAMGYRPYHERIDSYLEVAAFDATRFDDPDAMAERVGVRLASYAQLTKQHATELESLQRKLLAMQWAAARDVPAPTPMPEQPPPFEQAKKMFFDGPFIDPPTTIVALRDGEPVGVTVTMVKENGVAYTNFTGVARGERGKGIALMLKLRALRELVRLGVRLYGTTNDEANAAMRGINRRLGYTPEPTTIMVEKRVT